MSKFRFGSRLFTLEEIEAKGYDHGQTLTKYYPPSHWGTDDHEPCGPSIPCCEQAYKNGYLAGLKFSYMGDMREMLPVWA